MIVGVVGKPNVGKSTFFKALTLANVEIANYPFATIKPNSGVAHIRIDCVDTDFNTQCNPREGYCINHQRFVPIQVIDVAGLVPGAYEGKGMGNQFLDDLRQANALIHVIDCAGTTNDKGETVPSGSYDPVNDVRFLEIELDMWYLGILKKGWEKFARTIQQEHGDIKKALAKQLSGLGVTEGMIERAIKRLNLFEKPPTQWSEDELKEISSDLRKETKPMIIAANKIDIGCAKENLERLKKEFPDYIIVGCSAESELALKEAAKHKLIDYIPGDSQFKINEPEELSEKQLGALNFIKQNILEKFGSTGVQQVINNATLELLKLIAIFPGGIGKLEDKDGNVLPDCFLLPEGSTALDFAYKIHSDLGDNFIRAIDVKSKRTVGKEHLLKHRDVVEIISGK
jgi:ribosome-binding ATPase YchF (GTP1/OBG family)